MLGPGKKARPVLSISQCYLTRNFGRNRIRVAAKETKVMIWCCRWAVVIVEVSRWSLGRWFTATTFIFAFILWSTYIFAPLRCGHLVVYCEVSIVYVSYTNNRSSKIRMGLFTSDNEPKNPNLRTHTKSSKCGGILSRPVGYWQPTPCVPLKRCGFR